MKYSKPSQPAGGDDNEANEALVATESHYSKPLEVDLDRFQ